MSTALIWGTGAFLFGYILTLIIGKFLTFKNDALESYRFFKDPYTYIFLLFTIAFVLIGLSTPNFKDYVAAFRFSWIFTSLTFAGIIYLLFLLQLDNTLLVGIFVASLISAFLFTDRNSISDLTSFCEYYTVTGIGILTGLVVLGAKVLIGLPGVFSMVMMMLSLGLFLISIVGGIPLYLGLMATVMLGVFAGIFLFNRFERQLKLNEGAVLSSMFLFCALLLQGVNEFAGPSMLILVTYILAEFFLSLFFCYFLKRREQHLLFNTMYFSAFEKGVSLESIHMIIFKLCTVNIVLALFQLHSPNVLTLPFLAFVINFWLISKVYYSGIQEQTLTEINKTFMKNVKSEIVEIKQHFKKD